ncbi:MAG TPA: hypothetical protein VGX50_04195 [Longimicrobium sp.]|nr:hypothetical protein [Longimicrobium sp.]
MRTLPLLAAVLLASAPAGAQQVLRPGSAGIVAASLRERTETFDILERDAGGWIPLGEMTLRTVWATVEGRQAVVRTEQTWIDDELVQADSVVLDRRTLAPITARQQGVESSRWLHFGEGGRLRTIDGGDWGADTADVELAEAAFLFGLTDLVLGVLPLAEGYTADFAVYDPEIGFDTVRVVVEAREELRLDSDARVAVWRVRVLDDATGGTYWMDRESHALVQYENGARTLRIVRAAPGGGRSRPAR